jgi:hypothetical protein
MLLCIMYDINIIKREEPDWNEVNEIILFRAISRSEKGPAGGRGGGGGGAFAVWANTAW